MATPAADSPPDDLRGEADTANYTTTVGTTLSTKSTTGLYDDSRTARDWDDATWILTSSFIIFTMQSGELGLVCV